MADQNILVAAATIVILLVVYLASSFSSLELNEYGLDYSSIWKTVDQQVYTSGIHFLGFQHSFIKYPKSVQTVDFTSGGDSGIIESRTQDGLEVLLEMSFQYELQKTGLYNLYKNFGDEYKYILIMTTIDTIAKVSNNYTAYDFFVVRNNISTVMEVELTTILRDTMNISIKFFQLKSVDLPDSFEDAIQVTEVKKQDIEKAKAEKGKVLVEIETKLQKAEQNKQIILNKAYGHSNQTLLLNSAEVLSFNFTEISVVDGYTSLKNNSGFDNDELLNYIKSNIIAAHTGGHMIISL